ncbi:hypothetical protein Ahy_A07g035979 isoform B [Arachis hypogaea]|uniref:Aminotransferase-like plant mobile domain-containing protein n=1 Tax=Arachis hypogaea TaxID=3818 RepID=A0A445CEX8_ARAHY|nr:hypothetical protein Ahy_A07g035979 isoform B [Arachis hypogaea]
MAIGVDNEQDRLMFKRIFILYIQIAFLLPTTINKISHVHLAPIFKMDTITERNWGAHVLNFIIMGITDYNLKKKKAIDGCLFALMIVYFHLSKNKDKKGGERPPEPWIANWTRERLVERMRAEMEEHMVSEQNILGNCKDGRNKGENERNKGKRKNQKNQKNKKRKASSSSSFESETTKSEDHSTFESETEEDSEDPTRKQSTQKAKKEKEVDLRSTESHYVSSKTYEPLFDKILLSCFNSMVFLLNNIYSMFRIPDVNLGSDDPLSQGHTDQSSVNKSAESM